MSRKWVVLWDGAGEAAENMAVDHALFEGVIQGLLPPVIRFYTWLEPAVSVGRFQNIRRTLNHSALSDVDDLGDKYLVRRVTGGRGILHGDDLTVSVSAPCSALGLTSFQNSRIAAIYGRMAQVFQTAFAFFDVAAAPGTHTRPDSVDNRGDCFDIISAADMVSAETGAKLLGSAIHRVGEYFLMQTSIPLHTPQRREEMQAQRERWFRQAEARPSAPVFNAMALSAAIGRAFQDVLEIEPIDLPDDEDTQIINVRGALLQFHLYRNLVWTRDGKFGCLIDTEPVI